MEKQVNYQLFSNLKDTCLVLSFDLFQLSNKNPKNHITQYSKNRINYLKYAQLCVKTLSEVDDRFKSVSPVFLKEVLYPALGAEMAAANKTNKSKEEVLFPNYAQILKGINYFYKSCPVKLNLNQSEYSLINEVGFLKSNLQTKVG